MSLSTLALQTGMDAIVTGVNLVWVLTVTFLIFFMHAGFAMLEAGQVRSKNVANQLTKNLLTWSVGVMVFFLLGAAISTIVGIATSGGAITLDVIVGEFMAIYSPDAANVTAWTDWLFGAVFAMTAATIVSGAVAGRAKLRAYISYTILLAGVIYPVVVGFTWAGGFLGALGFHDFAGGMIVHGMGGLAGLTAAWIIGPRMDRFNPDGSVNVIPGHSLSFAVLGTLILAFGWYGFNVGTAAAPLAIDGGEVTLGSFAYVGRVALVTTLGMAAGAIGAAGIAMYKTGKVDTLYVANGLLAGLVGITSIADAIVWPGAIVVGLLAGAQLPIVFGYVEKRLQIDDVCAVFPVHGSAGILGALMFPFFATGLWNGSASFVSLAVPQVVGVAVIALWTFGATYVVFRGIQAMGELRVTAEHEREGLDTSEHGVDTYPEFGKPETVTDGAGVPVDGAGVPTDGTVRTDGGIAGGDDE
jgi:Amt family ammonium transporter